MPKLFNILSELVLPLENLGDLTPMLPNLASEHLAQSGSSDILSSGLSSSEALDASPRSSDLSQASTDQSQKIKAITAKYLRDKLLSKFSVTNFYRKKKVLKSEAVDHPKITLPEHIALPELIHNAEVATSGINPSSEIAFTEKDAAILEPLFPKMAGLKELPPLTLQEVTIAERNLEPYIGIALEINRYLKKTLVEIHSQVQSLATEETTQILDEQESGVLINKVHTIIKDSYDKVTNQSQPKTALPDLAHLIQEAGLDNNLYTLEQTRKALQKWSKDVVQSFQKLENNLNVTPLSYRMLLVKLQNFESEINSTYT